MKKRNQFLALALASILLMGCLSACGGSGSAATPAPSAIESAGPAYEDWVYTSWTGDLDSADPYGSTSAQQQYFTNLTFDTVTYVDADSGTVMGELARDWKDVSKAGDGSSWEIYLQKGVKFHNGDNLTAEDVKFTWEYAAAGAGKVVKPLSAAAYVSSIEAVDDYTVRFNLKSGMPDFPSYLETKIYSKHAFDTMDAAKAAVIGTGPYYYDTAETKSGVQFVATRNEDYWRGTENYPTKHICFKYIADENTAVASLQAGELDFCFNLSSSQYDTLSADDKLTVYTRSGANSYYLGFNYGEEKWKDLELRKAICQAINKDDIVAIAYEGGIGGTANYNFCVPTGLGHAEVDALEYDPAAAKEALASLGYGSGLEVTLIYYSLAAKVAEVIQSNLAAVGVTAKLQQIDGTNWTSLKASQKGYDLFLDYAAYQGALLYNFNRFFYSGGSSNVYGFQSDDYEALQDKVQNAGSWEGMLKEFATLQQWVVDNIPIFPIAYTSQIAAAQKDVKGLKFAPSTNYMDFSTAYIPARNG